MIQLWTDGSCLGNPGPGGWAFRLRWNDLVLDACGCAPHTTNNRMELQAVCEGLKKIKEASSLDVYSDSQYVVKAFTQNWLKKWLEEYEKSGRKKRKNFDLWLELYDETRMHEIKWIWVKGHQGYPDNEFCDQLALAAARDQTVWEKRWFDAP